MSVFSPNYLEILCQHCTVTTVLKLGIQHFSMTISSNQNKKRLAIPIPLFCVHAINSALRPPPMGLVPRSFLLRPVPLHCSGATSNGGHFLISQFFSVALDFTYGNLAIFSSLPSYPLSYLIPFAKSISAKTSQSEFCYLQTTALTKTVIDGRCGGGQQAFQEMRTCGCFSDVVRLKGQENPAHGSSGERVT